MVAMERTAIFPGSFNPFTIGHKSIVERALPLFDRIVIALGYNESKNSADDRAEREARVRIISGYFQDEDKIEVMSYSGLTVDFARRIGARFILRGVRDVADFENERKLADINRELSGIETVLMLALPCHGFISSSMVRELRHNGYDVSSYLP